MPKSNGWGSWPIYRLDAVLLSRVPSNRKPGISARHSDLGGDIGEGGAQPLSDDVSEVDEAEQLLDRYEMEAQQLEASAAKKGNKQNKKSAAKRRNNKERHRPPKWVFSFWSAQLS